MTAILGRADSKIATDCQTACHVEWGLARNMAYPASVSAAVGLVRESAFLPLSARALYRRILR